jgi:DNA-3-methyladenine glycosylase II
MNGQHLSHSTVRWTDCKQYIELHPPEPFSFDAILGYLMRASNECMFQAAERAVSRLVPGSSGRPVLVNISMSSARETQACAAALRDGRSNPAQPAARGGGSLHVSFDGNPEPPDEADRSAAARYIWGWLDLDTDLDPFYEMAGQDPLLAPVVQQFYGLRIVGIDDLFEALSWGIIGQQINLAFAYTLKRRLVEAYGQSIRLNDRTYWMFPAAETIAQLTVDDLIPLQLTRKKSEYLIGTARLIAEGALCKERLSALPDVQSAEKELTRIRGIGPWTANYVLMRCLRFTTAFPIEDVGLHNAIKHVLQLERKPSLDEIRQLSAGWGSWKAYATFYLWRVLY